MAPDIHPLPEAESERIYRERIRPLVLPDELAPVERPTFVILGGQPGAGKTGLLIESREALKAEGATVSVVGDDLRGFHPGYRALQRSDPENAALLTNPDASRWVERLLEEARRRRVNVVLETTMRQPDSVERIMTAFRASGYRTEARVVAVSERDSWQGMHLRYEATLKASGSARFTLKAVHDAAVVGMLTTLERIEEQGLAERVEVRRRSGEPVYVNERENGSWRHSRRAADVVLEERDRPPASEDVRRFGERWDAVLRDMANRDAPATAIASVERQARVDGHALDERLRRVEEQRTAPNVVLIPARQVSALTEAEVEERVNSSFELSARREALIRSARLAYGDEGETIASTLAIEASRSPQTARATATILLAEPERYGGLQGRGAGVLRGEDQARRSARAELPRLAEHVEDYGAAVERERRLVVEAHARDSQRQSQAVVLSRALQETFALPRAEQEQRVNGSEALGGELARLQAMLHRRLSGAERKAAHDQRTATLASALQLEPFEAKTVARIYRQASEHQPVEPRRQAQAISQVLQNAP